MDAIEKLQAEKRKLGERAEYYRREEMNAYAKKDFDRREEYRQLARLAVETMNGLDYAIAILKNS